MGQGLEPLYRLKPHPKVLPYGRLPAPPATLGRQARLRGRVGTSCENRQPILGRGLLTYTDIGRHILIVTKCVYLYQYKSMDRT